MSSRFATAADLVSGAQAASAQVAPSESSVPYPAYMLNLVDRAACLLKARWPAHVVEFSWWAEGEDTHYIGRMEWGFDTAAPRVIVYDGRSGDFVCRSLEGQPFEIDPATWCLDHVGTDELDRAGWQQPAPRAGETGRTKRTP